MKLHTYKFFLALLAINSLSGCQRLFEEPNIQSNPKIGRAHV